MTLHSQRRTQGRGRLYDSVVETIGDTACIPREHDSGASLGAAIQIAARAPGGSVICCMLPDTGERYLSTPLFDGVATEMTPEEEALSRSTPGFQMQAA